MTAWTHNEGGKVRRLIFNLFFFLFQMNRKQWVNFPEDAPDPRGSVLSEVRRAARRPRHVAPPILPERRPRPHHEHRGEELAAGPQVLHAGSQERLLLVLFPARQSAGNCELRSHRVMTQLPSCYELVVNAKCVKPVWICLSARLTRHVRRRAVQIDAGVDAHTHNKDILKASTEKLLPFMTLQRGLKAGQKWRNTNKRQRKCKKYICQVWREVQFYFHNNTIPVQATVGAPLVQQD